MAKIELEISCSVEDDRRDVHLVNTAMSIDLIGLRASDLRSLGDRLVSEADEMDGAHESSRGELLKLLEEVRHRIVPHADELEARVDAALGLHAEEAD